MAYLAQGTAQELFQDFGQAWVVSTLDRINPANGLQSTRFLGSPEQAAVFLEVWQKDADPPCSTQNDAQGKVQGELNATRDTIQAGNLIYLLGELNPLKKANEHLMSWKDNYQFFDFAYLSYDREPCGCMIALRRDDPSQWVVGIIKNTHRPHSEQTVAFLTGFDPKDRLTPTATVTVTQLDADKSQFFDQVGTRLIRPFLEQILSKEEGHIDLRVVRVLHLCRFLQVGQAEVLPDPVDFAQVRLRDMFAENKTLDILADYGLTLPYVLFKSCISERGAYAKAIAELPLGPDREANRAFLMLVIQSMTFLAEMGLTQDIPEYLLQEKKQNELKIISTVLNQDAKKVCLVFWTKGALSEEDYKKIIAAMDDAPWLAKLLLKIERTGEYSMERLKNLALDPQKRRRKALMLDYEGVFNEYQIYKEDIKSLAIADMDALDKALQVLQEVAIKNKKLSYHTTIRNDATGQLVRLFLPQFQKIEELPVRQQLMELFFTGVFKKAVIQAEVIERCTQEGDLSAAAKALFDRYRCAYQMLALGFPEAIVDFIAEEANPKSVLFRQVLMRVEAQCDHIHERLRRTDHETQRAQHWQNANIEYRKAIYAIAYEQLTTGMPVWMMKIKIRTAEAKLLTIVDPEIKSVLKKVLVIIANILITLLSVGIANGLKGQKTGNFWFFNHTKSGEKIRALNKEIAGMITPLPTPKIPSA